MTSHLCEEGWVDGEVDTCPSPTHSHYRTTRWQRSAALGKHSVNPNMEKFWATGDPSVFAKPGTLARKLSQ